MNKQSLIDAFRTAQAEARATKGKIETAMRGQHVNISYADAPYGLVTAMEHLDRFVEDLDIAIDELEGRDA
jgi:hypothetical protein